jgi:hypothetical protein
MFPLTRRARERGKRGYQATPWREREKRERGRKEREDQRSADKTKMKFDSLCFR